MVVGAKLNARLPFIVGLTRQILELNIEDIKVTTARDFSTPVVFHSFVQIINQYLVAARPAPARAGGGGGGARGRGE
jgi:hypothetical protein